MAGIGYRNWVMAQHTLTTMQGCLIQLVVVLKQLEKGSIIIWNHHRIWSKRLNCTLHALLVASARGVQSMMCNGRGIYPWLFSFSLVEKLHFLKSLYRKTRLLVIELFLIDIFSGHRGLQHLAREALGYSGP